LGARVTAAVVARLVAMAETQVALSESDLPIAKVYDESALDGFDAAGRLGSPGKFPFTRGVYPTM
jgi:methylmalonyl-CoA mutase N-terminal domain/subunit